MLIIVSENVPRVAAPYAANCCPRKNSFRTTRSVQLEVAGLDPQGLGDGIDNTRQDVAVHANCEAVHYVGTALLVDVYESIVPEGILKFFRTPASESSW